MDIITFFFPTEQPIAVVVNSIITAVLVTSLLALSTRGYIRLQRERRGLRVLQQALSGSEEISEETLQRCRVAPVVHERIKSLITLKDAGDEINQEVLAAVVASRLENSVRLVSWASYGVVLLGFSGTLLGLTSSVEGASKSLQSLGEVQTIEQATQPLLTTLDGIHVAFSTTLAGVLAAMILGVLLVDVRRRQTNFLTDLEQFTQNLLIPRYRTSSSLALLRAANTLTNLEERLDHSLRGIITELETRGALLVASIEDRFQSLLTSFQAESKTHLNQLISLHERLDALLGQGLEETPSISESFRMIHEASAALRDNVALCRQAVTTLDDSVREIFERHGNALNALVAEHTVSFNTNLERLAEVLSAGTRSAEDSLERLESSVSRIAEQEVAGSQVVESMGHVLQDLRIAVDRMKQAVLIHRHSAGEIMSMLRGRPLGQLPRVVSPDAGYAPGPTSDDIGKVSSEIQSGDGRAEATLSNTEEPDKPTGESPRSLFQRLFRRAGG
ncbi:MAG: hypothetical protein ACREX3_04470 [Gammaproteobacteria bacterium]